MYKVLSRGKVTDKSARYTTPLMTHGCYVVLRVLKCFVKKPHKNQTSHKPLRSGLTSSFYRAMLCIRGTSHGPVSVRPSVTSRSCTKTAKRRMTQTTPHDSFLKPKISTKFDRGHPLRGCQMQVGWVKIVDFRQITGYISKTVKDRHMVSIKVE